MEAINLFDFNDRFKTEEDCINYLIEKRRGGEPVCQHCGWGKCYMIKTRMKLKCSECRKQFSVKKWTIFEESRIELRKWFLTIFMITSLKKGISSIQLWKYLGVTQKTAWFMLKRIRNAVESKSFQSKLSNIVEADETYIGWKPRWRNKSKRWRWTDKAPVVWVIERNWDVRCQKVERVDAKTLTWYIQKNVTKWSHMMTDEYKSYKSLLKLGYTHDLIEHAKKVYVDWNIHTNNIECFWSHLKRGIKGIYIQVSKKHLDKYCDEYAFRYNTRDMNDWERFDSRFNRKNSPKLCFEVNKSVYS